MGGNSSPTDAAWYLSSTSTDSTYCGLCSTEPCKWIHAVQTHVAHWLTVLPYVSGGSESE